MPLSPHRTSAIAFGATLSLFAASFVVRVGFVHDGDFVRSASAAPRKPAAASKTVTFIGFHTFDDGTSRIFVKLTGPVPVEVKAKKLGIDFVLVDARIVVGNNENPLVTRDFESPVMSARAEPVKGSGVVLHIDLRKPVKPTHRMQEHPDGSATLYVDFPKPDSGKTAPSAGR